MHKAGKRKLLVAAPYFYPKIGGMEKYAWEISRGLHKNYGWEVVVVTSNHEEKKYKEEIIEGIKIYRLPYWYKISNTPINPMWYFDLKRIIKKEKPDIINGHSPVPFMADVAAALSYFFKIKYILTYQNDLIKADLINKILIRAYYLSLGKVTGLIASKIIITSGYYVNKSLYLRSLSDKVSVISPGINLSYLDSVIVDDRTTQKYTRKKVVLFVGQLDRTHTHKGLKVLIDALLIVKQSIGDIRLIVAGRGDMVEEYRQYSYERGLTDFIDFQTEVDDYTLVKYYKISDVVVLPSLNDAEGFGLTLIEANACKKPVVGSKVGGIPFVIEDGINGILVNPDNKPELASAILRLIKNSDYAVSLGENGYEMVKKNYQWQSKFSEYSNLLNENIIKS